jgi:hypothetical protein
MHTFILLLFGPFTLSDFEEPAPPTSNLLIADSKEVKGMSEFDVGNSPEGKISELDSEELGDELPLVDGLFSSYCVVGAIPESWT